MSAIAGLGSSNPRPLLGGGGLSSAQSTQPSSQTNNSTALSSLWLASHFPSELSQALALALLRDRVQLGIQEEKKIKRPMREAVVLIPSRW